MCYHFNQELLSLVSVAKRPKQAPTTTAAQSSGSDSSSESDDEVSFTLVLSNYGIHTALFPGYAVGELL